MILEGLATTRNADGGVNVAPMGPIVDDALTHLRLRPFPTSVTYANLQRTRYGVFHVTDDVLLLARAAVDRLDHTPATVPAVEIDGDVLADCCRWYEFRCTRIDESGERPVFDAEVVHVGRRRDFFGFNRAKHAVIEAAILASRLQLLGRDQVLRGLASLKSAVEKTGGPAEISAWQLLEDFVRAGATGGGRSGADQSF